MIVHELVPVDDLLLLPDIIPLVFPRLLRQNRLEQVVAGLPVHVQHLGGDDAVHVLLRHVVEQVPVVVVLVYFLDRFGRVLMNRVPLLLVQHLFVLLGLLFHQLFDFVNFGLRHVLRRLELQNVSLLGPLRLPEGILPFQLRNFGKCFLELFLLLLVSDSS